MYIVNYEQLNLENNKDEHNGRISNSNYEENNYL